MSSEFPSHEILNAQRGREFAAYTANLSLFEKEHFSNISEWLSEQNLAPRSETAYLATFSYIAGGWTTVTPYEIVANQGITSLVDAVSAAERGDLDDFSAYNTRHSHRKVNASYVAESFQSLNSLSVAGEQVESFDEFFETLRYRKNSLLDNGVDDSEAAHKTFKTAWNSLKSISYFGPLSAFDWLEVVVFVHGDEWIAPKEIRPEYFDTGSNPSKGFEAIFGSGIESEEATQYTDILEDYAYNILGKDMPSAMFDMESALCVFYKDLDEVEELVKETSTVDTDCLPNRSDDC
ncbi:hypothetical protein ACFOZ7_12985 [Natribaculum luteum]|uniref:Amino acid:DNA transferase domain-containing protein n=1 Tax=Natribaculum luteum TaxID=1586232 RepID=A0ABD5P0N9_9EURY|nr:hypothetical protein [Natribaculum luteum]